MAIEVLLIEDVTDLGRSGQVHRVAPGFARNFLIPKGFAVIADRNTLRKQERLSAERTKRAEADRAESEKLVGEVADVSLSTVVKVDPHGQMYGSVTAADVQKLFEQAGHLVERRFIVLAHPIKTTGSHSFTLRLKEGVECTCKIDVLSESQQAALVQ